MQETITEQRVTEEQEIYEENSTDSEGVTYLYDELNRLVCIEYSDGTVIQYEYDVTGNILNAQSKLKNDEEVETSENMAKSYIPESERLQNQNMEFLDESSEIEETEELVIGSSVDTTEHTRNIDNLIKEQNGTFCFLWCLIVSIALFFIIIMITVCGKRGKVKNENTED